MTAELNRLVVRVRTPEPDRAVVVPGRQQTLVRRPVDRPHRVLETVSQFLGLAMCRDLPELNPAIVVTRHEALSAGRPGQRSNPLPVRPPRRARSPDRHGAVATDAGKS